MSRTIIPWDYKLFLQYLTFWHGDHCVDNFNSPCEIYDELQKFNAGESSIEKLKEIFDEVDGDWDSLQQYMIDRY